MENNSKTRQRVGNAATLKEGLLVRRGRKTAGPSMPTTTTAFSHEFQQPPGPALLPELLRRHSLTRSNSIQRLREQQTDAPPQRRPNNNKRPKHPRKPATPIGHPPADHRPHAGAEVERHAHRAHNPPALARHAHVRNNTIADSVRGASAKALESAQDEQRSVAVLIQCQAEIAEGVEGQREEVDRAAAEGVGERAEEGGRERLEDDVERDGEVDGLGRGVEVRAEERQEREVDGGGQWGGGCCEADEERELEFSSAAKGLV